MCELVRDGWAPEVIGACMRCTPIQHLAQVEDLRAASLGIYYTQEAAQPGVWNASLLISANGNTSPREFFTGLLLAGTLDDLNLSVGCRFLPRAP